MNKKLTDSTVSNKEKYELYLFSYGYKDQRWSFEIMATSPEDAKARVNRIQYAHYDGGPAETIPWHPALPVSWGKRLMNGIIRILNFFRTVTKRKE